MTTNEDELGEMLDAMRRDPASGLAKLEAPHACRDCVDVHGDTPAEWLAKWPTGAEWHADYAVHLCDGCREERDDWQATGATGCPACLEPEDW